MPIGIVTKSTGKFYEIEFDNKIVICRLRGKMRTGENNSTNPVAVGDFVDFEFEKDRRNGIIESVHERKNCMLRKSINLSRQSHIIAANIDLAFLVITIKSPQTYPAFIDRFLVTCEAYKIQAVIVINKTDIYNEKEISEMENLISIYEKIGYICLRISVKNLINLNKISELIENKTILISGNSGVGKSSLVNAISPELNLKTAGLTTLHDKGKHTTTFAQMFKVGKGRLIDTPGIKGLGLVNLATNEIHHYFPEMFSILSQCRFPNCTHTHEPDCAVKKAVSNNEISESRYNSYISILTDDEDRIRTDAFR